MYPPPIPTTCRYCNGAVKLAENKEVYGRNYGNNPFIYLCTNCRAYVGTHPMNPPKPLGTLANQELRKARENCKKPFKLYEEKMQALAASKKHGRYEAYKRLANEMKIQMSECHFGLFEIDQCEQAREISISFLSEFSE